MPIRSFLSLAKALADPGRLRALLALRHGELCVCQLTELLGLAPSTASKHLSILHQAGLVDCRKDGRWIYYRLPDSEVAPPVRTALDWVTTTLADDSRVMDDARQLQRILELDPTELCKRQCKK